METADGAMKEGKKLIIVLHEIYGLNLFIKEQQEAFQKLGYTVICPDLLGRQPFPYEQEKQAYDYFMHHIGFDCYTKINDMATKYKVQYKKVFLLGFSVGATIAWRCSEHSAYDSIICLYGSRIRDYLDVVPVCPISLLFAQRDSFPVTEVISQLQKKEKVTTMTVDAFHGFLDPYGRHYDAVQKDRTEQWIQARFNC